MKRDTHLPFCPKIQDMRWSNDQPDVYSMASSYIDNVELGYGMRNIVLRSHNS